MKEFSVVLALVDFIPVILFGIAAVILQRMFYERMSKGAFALFAAGTIDVIFAGGAKALYKLLYATGICDMEPLSALFFPVQSVGFLLAGFGMIAMLFYKQKSNVLYAVVPPVFKGTFVFVGLTIVGLLMMYIGLITIAVKKKKFWAIVLFVLAFFVSLGMGYLSSKDFSQAYMNWIAQCTNILGQGFLLSGVVVLKKS